MTSGMMPAHSSDADRQLDAFPRSYHMALLML